MRRYLAVALACVLAGISVSALAMGLGEIRLNSYLNQRLDAEIELVSATADELESLEIGLADRAAFSRYGLERDAILSSLEFNVVRRSNGTAYVKITSSEPIREPFLTFLVNADWSRGRLLREYTVLLDPPTFASREQQAAPAEAQAPAVAQEPEAPVSQPAEDTPREQPQPERPQVAESQTGDVVSIPPLDDDEQAATPVRRAPEPAAQQPDSGGSYGPIQRNETLWGIAQRLRPDDSVTINQMMLALYRANPEAFQGNINRLKAGYILRIPDYSEISSLTRREAFGEVKRQNEEWRGTSRPAPAAPVEDTEEPAPVVEAEPELSLVAPEEELTSETGLSPAPGEETADSGVGAETGLEAPAETDEGDAGMDLGIEDESSDRLLELEDESMQALQSQDEPVEEIAPPPLPEESTDEPVDETAIDEPVIEPAPAESEPATEAAGTDATETDEAAAIDEPAGVEEQAVPARPEPGLVERLMSLAFGPLGLGIAAFVLVLLLAGFLVIRKRRDAVHAKVAAAAAAWDEEDGDDVTVVAGADDTADPTVVNDPASSEDGDSVFAHGMQHEDTGTAKLDDASATQMLGPDETQHMMPDSETDKAPEGGPEAEGDDEFADTVFGGQSVKLDDNDPLSEADFHMAYGLYDQAAEVVQKAVERDPTRKDFHAKLAEIHFAAGNTDAFLEAAGKLKELAGTGDSDWENVAIMGRQIAPDNELFGEGGSTSSVDLDFGSADQEFADDEPASEAPAPETSTPEAPTDSDESLDFDISMDTEESPPAAEEPAPPNEPVSQDEPAADDGMDFDLDIGGLGEDAGTPAEEGARDDEGAAAADDSADFDLGEFAAGSGDESETDETPSEEGDFDDAETQTEFDKALEELSAFVDTNVPEENAGDATDAGQDQDNSLSLDEFSFDQESSEAAAEPDETGTGEDEDDIGEIGTKLDLARAYIDMGDPDGARSILEEVVADGDDEQQKEAQALLDTLA